MAFALAVLGRFRQRAASVPSASVRLRGVLIPLSGLVI